MFEARKAEREKVSLMIGIDGPPGSGKTLGALKVAYGITGDWSKIAVADTENDSALYYAGEQTGDWLHIPFKVSTKDAYSPNNFVKLIEYAETLPIEVLIIDSISHEWNGEGGCLDIVNNIGGNSFTAWKQVTPMHNKFVDRMRHSTKHIIATMRSKTDYVIEENDRGKKVPKKVGMASIQREGVEYEFGCIFSVALNHRATVEKDRTNLFIDRPPFVLSEETGKELKAWAGHGKEQVYEGLEHQKRALLEAVKKLCPAMPVDSLKALHEKLMGIPMNELIKTVAKEVRG